MTPRVAEEISYTVIALVFFFACGSLYLIGYWEVFDVDVSNIIGPIDVPKSFVFSFVRSWESFAFAILSLFTLLFWSLKDNDFWLVKSPQKAKKMFTSLAILIATIIGFAFGLHDEYSKSDYRYWMIFGNLLSIAISFCLYKTGLFKKKLEHWVIRAYLITIMVSGPIMSYSIGKAKAVDIFKKNEFKYVIVKPTNIINNTIPKLDSTGFKLLGFLGDKLIISTIDNKRVLVLNQSAFEVTELVNNK